MSALHPRAEALTAQVVQLRRPASPPAAATPAYAAIAVRAGVTFGAHARMHDALDLSRTFGARLVAVGCPGDPLELAGACGRWSGRRAPPVSAELEREAAAAAVRRLAGRLPGGWDWRWRNASPTAALLDAAWEADLFVADREPDAGEDHGGEDLAQLLRVGGVPVLVRCGESLPALRRVAVACDDGPATRRALAAALPLLARAEAVQVFGSDADAALEVARRLRRRGIAAAPDVHSRREFAALDSSRAELVVAGAGQDRSWGGAGRRRLRELLRLPVPLLLCA